MYRTPGMGVDLDEAFSQQGEYRVTVQRGDDAPVAGLVGIGENADGERVGGTVLITVDEDGSFIITGLEQPP